MQYRTFGKTGLKVSLLSYGTGGPGGFGRTAGLTHADQAKLARHCLELGINLFDTAEAYGKGLSETDLGRALKGVRRDSYYLATKWMHHYGDGEVLKKDPAELEQSVNDSLERLQTDYVDVMQFHGLAPNQYAEVVTRFYPTMKKLQEQGKVRFIGFSEYLRTDAEHSAIVHAVSEEPDLWDTVMLKYGILYQWAAVKALPLAKEKNVGVLNMAPVRLALSKPGELQKLLAEWESEGLISCNELPSEDPLGWLVKNGVPSVVSAGYKFGASHPGVSTVITGTSSIKHLEENAAALEDPVLPGKDEERLVEIFGRSALPFSP